VQAQRDLRCSCRNAEGQPPRQPPLPVQSCISYYTVVPLCTTVHTALHSPKFTGLCVTLQWNSNSIHLHPYQALTRLEEGSYKGLSDTLAACRCPATCTSQVLPRRASAVMGCLSRAPTITYSTRTHCTVRKKRKKNTIPCRTRAHCTGRKHILLQ